MPHIGRRYPFHPTYWATEAWFWPGRLPWKYHGEKNLDDEPPWDAIPAGWTGISDVGVPSTDAKIIVYTFNFVVPDGDCTVKLTLKKLVDPPDTFAYCLLQCFLGGSEFIFSESKDSYEQRTANLGTFGDGTTVPGGLPVDPPSFFFRPATYDEGGTPFPHPTGGPPP